VRFTSPVTNQEASDTAGDILGEEQIGFWLDHKSAKVNAIRTKSLVKKCDIAVLRFGEKCKRWNAAFDAGYCAALGESYITLRDEGVVYPLKEVDAQAMAWATTPAQVIEILEYVVSRS